MKDLFSQLFKQNSSDPDSRDLLLKIVKEYPYFTAPHFFLLQKTDSSHSEYEQIAAKAALHFNNPFLLNYRLNKVVEKKQTIESPIEIAEAVVEDNKSEILPLVEETVKAETSMEIAQDNIPIPPVEIEVAKDAKPEKEEMLFEPLFASDYFASQGIKLSEEIQTGDKLGKQLKSFTEWLKSMKKVHEKDSNAVTEKMDVAVQTLAEKSNQEADILTESMAEAFLQQGKTGKALMTLEKLSLLNPAKSAYFAAKIEQITQNQ